MITVRTILTVAIALSVQSTTLAEQQEKKADSSPTQKEQKVERRSVSARVDSAVGKGVGIRAEKVPGEFTVPEGMTARNFKYTFHDAKSKIKLDKLTGSSIYSVTEKRYISEAASGSDFKLPPGKYKFVVGGRPGAYGSLSFDVAPGDNESVVIKDGIPEADLPTNGTVTVVIWVSERPEYKFQWNFEIKSGVVTGTGEVNGPPHPSPAIVNEKSDYRFQGKLVKKHIKGIASQKVTWDSLMDDGGRMNHIYEGEGELELQLRIDQTVVGSETHSGRTNGEPSIQNAKHNWIGKWSMGNK